MSGEEKDYRDADELVHDVADDNRRRRRDRARERDRLRRMHTDEAAQDRQVAEYAKLKRALHRYRLEREPRRVRRSLRRLSAGFVVIAVFGAALAALYPADLAVDRGLAGWAVYGAAILYVAGFVGAVLWHDRRWWTRTEPPRAPAAAVRGLLAVPVPPLVAAAWAGWAPWLGVLVVLGLFLLFVSPVFVIYRSAPADIRVPR